DPALPYRFIGWKRQLRQIIDCLIARALDAATAGAVRVAVDGASRDRRTLQLRLIVRDRSAALLDEPPEDRGDEDGPLALVVAARLAQLMGGDIGSEDGILTATVPLTIDEPAVDPAPDLAGCTVLLATEQDRVAGELMAWVTAWQGDSRRIRRFEGASDSIAQ